MSLVTSRRIGSRLGSALAHCEPQVGQVVGLSECDLVKGQERLRGLLSGLLAMKDRARWFTFSKICAAFRSLAASRSHFAASLRSNSSGIIEQPPFAHYGRRQRSYDVGRARVEIAVRQPNHIYRGLQAPKDLMDAPVAVEAFRRVVGQHDAEVQIAVRSGFPPALLIQRGRCGSADRTPPAAG